jgi:hypothetical protein
MLLRDSVDSVIAHSDVAVLGTNAISGTEVLNQLSGGSYLVDFANLQQPILKAEVSWTPKTGQGPKVDFRCP